MSPKCGVEAGAGASSRDQVASLTGAEPAAQWRAQSSVAQTPFARAAWAEILRSRLEISRVGSSAQASTGPG